MSEELKAKRMEIAHVLFMDIVGYSTRLTDEQQALVDELNQIVRSSDEFNNNSVCSVSSMVICRTRVADSKLTRKAADRIVFSDG